MVRAVYADPRRDRVRLRPGDRDARSRRRGRTRAGEPRTSRTRRPTVSVSLDELQALCPNLERVALVVAWFGDDLRAGPCTIQPGRSTTATKVTHGATWQVAGVDARRCAAGVSRSTAAPAYGGTPSDRRVIDLIAELKARGLKVTLYPFVMMDIPAGQCAARSADRRGVGQPAYPWRGRITCDPAPGQPGSPDGHAARRRRRSMRFLRAAGDAGRLELPAAWCCITPTLAATAGGVDAFLIGSELRGLTRVRSAPSSYPAVAQLRRACRRREGDRRPDDDDRHLRRRLDRIFRRQSVDGCGRRALSTSIRCGRRRHRCRRHRLLRAALGLARRRRSCSTARRRRSIYDRDYLAANVARRRRLRLVLRRATPTARRRPARRSPTGLRQALDLPRQGSRGAGGRTPHYERVGGVELATPTAGCRKAKPIWLTEARLSRRSTRAPTSRTCFPIRNRPDGGLPHFSNGARDDLIQRRYLEAILVGFRSGDGATRSRNPVSSVYGGRMVEPSRDPSLDLGRAALSGLSRPRRRLERRRQLGDRALADRPARRGAAGRADRGDPGPMSASTISTSSALRRGARRLRDRPADVGARRDRTAGAAYAFDAAEADGKLVFRPRGGAPVTELARTIACCRSAARRCG